MSGRYGQVTLSTTLPETVDRELCELARRICVIEEKGQNGRCTPHALMRDIVRGLLTKGIVPKRPTDFRKYPRGTGTTNRTVTVYHWDRSRIQMLARSRQTTESKMLRAGVLRYLKVCSPILWDSEVRERRVSPFPFYLNGNILGAFIT